MTFKAKGSLAELRRTAKMLETYGPELFPVNEEGKIHFARALMESAAEAIRLYLRTRKTR